MSANMEATEELFLTLPNRVRICYQTFGRPSDPAVVLIPGHSGSMLTWPEDMIRLFNPAGAADATSQSYFVIRYDPRDTGLSTEFPVPSEYDLNDMASDVEGLVDHLLPDATARSFHLVGASLGGPIAYIIAARRPSQVRSMTLIVTTPGASSGLPMGPGVDPGSPPMGFGNVRQGYIDYSMRHYDLLTTKPDAAEREYAMAGVVKMTEREMKSGTLYSKGFNHGSAASSPRPGVETLKDLRCATTVIQAALDPFFGVAHGEMLAEAIPGAEYVLWEDVGHEIPRRIWGRLADVLLQTWKKGNEQWTA